MQTKLTDNQKINNNMYDNHNEATLLPIYEIMYSNSNRAQLTTYKYNEETVTELNSLHTNITKRQ